MPGESGVDNKKLKTIVRREQGQHRLRKELANTISVPLKRDFALLGDKEALESMKQTVHMTLKKKGLHFSCEKQSDPLQVEGQVLVIDRPGVAPGPSTLKLTTRILDANGVFLGRVEARASTGTKHPKMTLQLHMDSTSNRVKGYYNM